MKKLSIILILALAFFACKVTDAGANADGTDTTPDSPKTWKVTIDQNGGNGLTQTTYDVKDGESLKALSNTSTKDHAIIVGYKYNGSTDYIFGTTPVKSDITIVIQWDSVYYVNIHENGGSGLTKTKYEVKTSVAKLDAVEGTSTQQYMSFAGYKNTADNSDFILGTTPVNKDVNLLIKWNRDDNSVDCTGISDPINQFLTYAAENPATIKKLACGLKSGVDLNTRKDLFDQTALMKASTYGQLGLIKYLLANQANINSVSSTNNTALTLASLFGFLDCVKYLATYPGVDLSIRENSANNTALGIAKMKALEDPTNTVYPQIVSFLQSIGAPE